MCRAVSEPPEHATVRAGSHRPSQSRLVPAPLGCADRTFNKISPNRINDHAGDPGSGRGPAVMDSSWIPSNGDRGGAPALGQNAKRVYIGESSIHRSTGLLPGTPGLGGLSRRSELPPRGGADRLRRYGRHRSATGSPARPRVTSTAAPASSCIRSRPGGQRQSLTEPPSSTRFAAAAAQRIRLPP